MKKVFLYIGILAMMLASCSTQKNTGASRAYHSMKVKYNVYYNGDLAYQEGLEAIAKAHTDDYSNVLPLYPVSDHKAAEASKSKMERTIEKCRKCIKLHSIKKRPKTDPKKMKDPKYKAWLQQEEFNPSMPMAWIRLGEAEFHKGDFLGAVSTFGYIMNHFDYDKDLVARCQLWQARSYGEMDWLYEAEDLLRKVQIDDLSRKHAAMYSAVSADIMLKQKRYHEAIPHVLHAKNDEDKQLSRPRFEYVLGQLYEKEGNRAEALAAYKRVLKLQPEWVMDFNARLRKTQLEKNSTAALTELDKMIKRPKYKEYLDQLHGAKANILLQRGDTTAALVEMDSAIARSTRNGMEKATILLQAGDIYYHRKQYEKAEPCYTEAVSILTADMDEYKRVKKRQEVLGDLVQQTTQVALQDSLQRLSKMTEAEQMAVVQKIIADLVEQEKRDSIAQKQADREAQNGGGLQSVNTSNMIGGGGSGEWYFYNPQLMKIGKQQFRQKWGTRTLEDNWRYKIKVPVTPIMDEPDEDELLADEDSIGGDSAKSITPLALSEDPHDPQYYLQQIPHTEEDMQQSDTLIADALKNMVAIYRDQLEENDLAVETFEELKRRYPGDKRLEDIYYMQYLIAMQQNDSIAAEQNRRALLAQYPDGRYAKVVNDPQYFDKLRLAQAQSDSLYEQTYEAYRKGQYAEVKKNVKAAEENYPLSSLMPRFLFLQSVAVAKTEGQDAFADNLREMVNRYPDSEMSSMAKDMLSMMNQGLESQKGGKTSDLSEMRQQQMEEEQAEDLAMDTTALLVPQVIITLPKNEASLNKLLYEVALYNFAQFMIKDFDLETLLNYSASESALLVKGFDSAEEVEWYKGLLMQSEALQQAFTKLQAVLQ